MDGEYFDVVDLDAVIAVRYNNVDQLTGSVQERSGYSCLDTSKLKYMFPTFLQPQQCSVQAIRPEPTRRTITNETRLRRF